MATSRHFCIAALSMVIPPFVAADGIRFVSTRGPSVGGVREVLHAVVAHALGELEARLLLLGAPLPPMNPGGSRSLHAPMAFFHAAVLGSSDEPFAIPSMVSAPDASGSGNSLTPLSRMHSANFTACS